MLQILGEENPATCLFCGAKDQSIPEREAVKAVKVDRAEYVSNIDLCDIELCQQFHLAASDLRVNVQLACCRDEVFLKDLERDNSGLFAPMLGNQFDGSLLFRRSILIVGVKNDVRVEEATNAHESRPG